MPSDSPPPSWYEPPAEEAPPCSGVPDMYRCDNLATTTLEFDDLDEVPLYDECASLVDRRRPGGEQGEGGDRG